MTETPDLTTLRLSRVVDPLKLTNRAILDDGGYEQEDVVITTESAIRSLLLQMLNSLYSLKYQKYRLFEASTV